MLFGELMMLALLSLNGLDHLREVTETQEIQHPLGSALMLWVKMLVVVVGMLQVALSVLAG